MKVKKLAIAKLKPPIQKAMTKIIRFTSDVPDKDKTLKSEVEQRLLASLQKACSGERGVPASEVAKRLGLKW